MRIALLGGVALIALTLAAEANAQAAPPVDATDGTPALAEVIVTAQRRAESLQKAAIPVSVIDPGAVSRVSEAGPGQLSRLVPALAVQSAGGANTTFFIRGVGNFTVNGYSDPATAFNYDGIYIGRPTSTSGVFYDLERVEVLKGPQGTLYGRNATAGALNIIPVRPKLGDFSGYVSATIGDHQTRAAQGAVNVPIGASSALRLSGNLVRHDGYLSDGTSDERNEAFRAQFLTELSDDITVRLAADYSHTGGLGSGAAYALSFRFSPLAQSYVVTPSGLAPSVGLFDPRSDAYRRTIFAGLPGRTLGSLGAPQHQDNTYYGANAELEWRTGAGTLTVIPGVRRADLDNVFGVPGFYGFIQEKDDQSSIEARFAGDRVGRFDYLVGAYAFDETVKGDYTFSQDALAAYQEFTSKTKSLATFGRVTAHLSDRLRLVGGLRYTRDDKDFTGVANVITVVCTVRNANGVPSCPNAPVIPLTDNLAQLPFPVPAVSGAVIPIIPTGAIVTRADTPVDRSLSNHRLTERAAVEFDVSARSLLYASFENGYRSGGFALSFGKETFEPEYIDAYTVGSKNRFFDNTLQLNAEVFYWKYRNQQVNHTGIDLRGNQGQFTDNVGRSTIKGFDIDGQWAPVRNTLLSANVQYLDGRYDSFVYTAPVGNAPPYVGCATSIDPGNPAIRNIDCSGKRTYNSPKWTLNLSGQQTVNLGAFDLVLLAETQYRTARYVGFEYLPYQYVSPNWTSNLYATLKPADEGRWALTAFARNLENKRVVTSAPIFNIGGLGEVVTSPPRTYGLRLETRF